MLNGVFPSMTKRTTAAISSGALASLSMGQTGRAAWVLWRGDEQIASGFSRNQTLARQAARKARNQLTGRAQYNAALRRYRYASTARTIYAQLRGHHGGFTAWNRTVVAAERSYRIEITFAVSG